MIPADALNRIRSVTILYTACIEGFSFFDKDGALLYKIGWNNPSFKKETVVLADNEVIAGVVAKLFSAEQFYFTDFQFQIAI